MNDPDAETELVERYFAVVNELGINPAGKRLPRYLARLFEEADFTGKRVLDIGAGRGLFTLYAACRGATEVVGIEPEADGSFVEAGRTLTEVLHRLPDLSRVRIVSDTFQVFDAGESKFDTILLHDSINHLDEDSCIRLLRDEAAKEKYREVFTKIGAVANPGAQLIACDCTRYNLFAALGVRNPFMPTIEWHKHQSPGVWADMLSEVGFRRPRVSWFHFDGLPLPGEWLLNNKAMSYFLWGHFCLRMEKS